MKTRILKTLALLLVAATMLSLVACGGSTTTATTAPATTSSSNGGNTASTSSGGAKRIVIQTLSDPGTYTAFEASSSVSLAIQPNFYEPLFAKYRADELTPIIAKSYDRVGEGEYVIVINEGVVDSKGNPITIDDIVWNFNHQVEVGQKSTVYGNMKSVEKIDDTSFRMTFGEEFVGEFETIVCQTPMISKASFEQSSTGFASDPIGSGPYKIKSWTQGSSLVLEKNENYWNKDNLHAKQPYDEIEYRFIGESTQVALALETGAVDMALGISNQDVSKFRDNPAFNTIEFADKLTRMVLFNCDPSNPFSDVKLRQAFCYAIDAEAIITTVTEGFGIPCKTLAGARDASMYPDYNEAWNDKDYYEYNPEKAKELLAEAGYADGLKIRIMTKDTPEYRTTCEIMQAYLAEIGVQMEIMAYENALYQTYRYDPTTFDLMLAQIGGQSSASFLCPWKWYVQPNPIMEGKNMCMFKDDEFWKIYGDAAHVSTWSPETIQTAVDWMDENVPMYAYGFTSKFFIHNNNIVDAFVSSTGDYCPWMDGSVV